VKPATTEEINVMLQEEVERFRKENQDLRRKLYDVELEMNRYKTSFKTLVKELSEIRK
jgi:predicted  nucleic acid-binding Zn-ribbon protein